MKGSKVFKEAWNLCSLQEEYKRLKKIYSSNQITNTKIQTAMFSNKLIVLELNLIFINFNLSYDKQYYNYNTNFYQKNF